MVSISVEGRPFKGKGHRYGEAEGELVSNLTVGDKQLREPPTARLIGAPGSGSTVSSGGLPAESGEGAYAFTAR
jgi:hypothetical protein